MTYQEALERVELAFASVRNPKTHEASFERAILAMLIELELLKIEDGDGNASRHMVRGGRERAAKTREN